MSLTHLATNLNSFLILTHMVTHRQFTLVEFQVSYNKFDLVCYSEDCSSNKYVYKGYLPNLLVITLLPWIFVYWARYFKFWLLAYFLILLNSAKFEEDWTTFILDILQLVNYKNKKHQPCKMCNINVVQSFPNFAQFGKIKNKQVSKIWSI